MALSATPTDYANLCTGRLADKVGPTTATGFVVTADTFKTPAGTGAATWPTGPQVWKISRKTRTTSEVEFVGVETATQSGSTITTGTVNRYLPANGSSLTSQGNGITFPAGSVVELVWHAFSAEKVAYKDVANTFTENVTLDTTKELRFNSSATAIWKDASNLLSFKDAANGTKTLTQLAAASGADEKAKISSNDTTQGYLNGKLVAGAGITLTENNDGSSETLSVIASNTVATGHTGLSSVTSGGLLVGAGTSNMTVIGPGTSGQVPTSNGSTIAMETPKSLNVMSDIGLNSVTLTDTTSQDLHGTFTIGANTLAAGTKIEMLWEGTATMNGGHSFNTTLAVGSLTFSITLTNTGAYTDNRFSVRGTMVCLSTGASGKVLFDFETQTIGSATAKVRTMSTTASTLDTTASNIVKISVVGDGAGASGNVKQYTALAFQSN